MRRWEHVGTLILSLRLVAQVLLVATQLVLSQLSFLSGGRQNAARLTEFAVTGVCGAFSTMHSRVAAVIAALHLCVPALFALITMHGCLCSLHRHGQDWLRGRFEREFREH